jgi:hypothetical protein
MENEKQKLLPVGALLAQTWQMYSVNFKKFTLLLLFSLIGYIPLVIVFLMFLMPFGEGTAKVVLMVFVGFLAVLSVIFSVYWQTSSFVGIFCLLKDPSKKIKEAFAFGRKHFWGYLAVSILTGILVLLWSFLFIIPGLIFGIFYSFALYVFIFEDFQGLAAIKRSKELVGGYWWPVFWRLSFGTAIVFFASFILGLIFGFVLLIVGEESAMASILSNVFDLLNFVFSFFFTSVVSIIFPYLIYKDLARIKPESKVEPEKKSKVWVAVLIILVVIIMFLSTLSVVALNNARIKSRDASRISDSKQILTGLEIYIEAKGACPESLADLKTESYIIGNTTDPVSEKEYEYIKNGDRDCEICFNMEDSFGGFEAGKNCLKTSAE